MGRSEVCVLLTHGSRRLWLTKVGIQESLARSIIQRGRFRVEPRKEVALDKTKSSG